MNIRLLIALPVAALTLLAGCRFTFIESSEKNEERLRRLEERIAREGSDGQRGVDGMDGQDGMDGKDGRPGVPGRDSIHVRGSGNVITENRPVAGFSEVLIRGSATLLIDQTGSESLQVEAEDNLTGHLVSEVVGNRLELKLAPGVSLEATRPVIFRLTVAKLAAVVASGSGEIEAKRLKAESLSVRQSGSFDVTVQGTASRQKVRVSGSGSYLAEELETQETEIDISGSGEAVVRVGRRLDVTISGSGRVQYVGDPSITRQIRGSGALEKKT